MRTRLFGTVVIAALALSACGGGGGKQGEVADMMLASAAQEGIDLDEKCVRDVAGKLSDDDAAKIVAAGMDGDPDVSADAEALAGQIFGCFDTDAMVDQIIGEMGDEGVDAECLKKVLREQGMDALETGAMFECMDFGSMMGD